jgi:hypothetical protein
MNGHFMSDEQGNRSLGRALLLTHTGFNWIWMWLFILGRVKPMDSDVLNMLIGSLDVTMFIVFGAWVVGPRSFQYLFPQIGSAVQGAGALLGRAKGTDDRYKDDERDL